MSYFFIFAFMTYILKNINSNQFASAIIKLQCLYVREVK